MTLIVLLACVNVTSASVTLTLSRRQEIAYLKWLSPKFIDNNFIEKYNDHFKIDKNYYIYEPIYQLYYSLMNVYLWNRLYIQEINKILKKIKI